MNFSVFKKTFVLYFSVFIISTIAASAASLNLLRAYCPGDHFYTTDWGEMINAIANGYTYEGVTAVINTPNDLDADRQIFRLWNSYTKDHFYTTDFWEAINAVWRYGYVWENSPGYTSKTQRTLIYRAYHPYYTDHFYTANYYEYLNAIWNLGFIPEVPLGFGK